MLAHAARLPVVLPGSQLHLGFVLAIMLAAGLWWVLGATAIGFRVRAVGAGVAAAAAAGRVHVARTVFRVFLASGGIAGLAGAAETTGRTFALYDGSPGFGYTAIAVALLARLNPLAVVASGIFFGALEASAAALQRDAGLPFALVTAVEAMIVLGVLAVERLGAESRVPAAAMPETA